MRYFFEIAYHGAAYSGWQSQPNAVGIQAVVEDALTKLLREEISITGSGRTDAGVHCEQQFFHADIEKEFDRATLLAKLNAFLPKSVAIHTIRAVQPEASARYDAYERTYHYRITRVKDPFTEGLALFYFRPLDIDAMNRAAATMLGEHDFACFSKVQTDVKHFRCDMKKAEWREDGSRLEFTITANRFLRGMVRAVVGTLLDVGSGRTSLREFQAIVQSGDRKKAGANAPPHGLYLSRVKYHSRIFVKE
jgi:tRNA pseudouridine38-40 synthase